MNQTKKITQGALMLAIVFALMYINLRMANVLDTFIILAIPVVIILYSSMNDLRDGMILCFSMGLMGIILGVAAVSPSYIAYFPVSMIVGIGYSWGVKKDFSKGKLLMTAILLFVLGEIIVTFLIMPLLGIPVKEMLKEMKVMFSGEAYAEMGESGAVMKQAMEQLIARFGDKFDAFILALYILVVGMTGVLEGAIIHILSVFLLRRFRVKELGSMSLYDVKDNPVIAYLCIGAIFAFFLAGRSENATLFAVLTILALIGAIILIYYGYVFVMLYGGIVLKRNLTLLLMLMMFFLAPVFVITMVITGFLYCSGPLRRYIETKRNSL